MGDAGAVDRYLQLGSGRFLVDGNIRGTFDLRNHFGHLLGHPSALVDVVGVDLQGQVAVGTGYLVHHHVDDGLGESRRIAGDFFNGLGHGFDKLGLCAAGFPCVVGLQSHTDFDVGEGETLGAFVVAAQLGHDI